MVEATGVGVLLHVTFAAMWAGGGVYQVLVVGPALKAAGPDAAGFMMSVARRGGIGWFFAASGLATILAGGYLYGKEKIADAPWDGGNLYITLGAIVAVLAFLHGLAASMPVERRWLAFMRGLKGPPTPEQGRQLAAFGRKMSVNGTVSVALVVLSLLLMLMRRVDP